MDYGRFPQREGGQNPFTKVFGRVERRSGIWGTLFIDISIFGTETTSLSWFSNRNVILYLFISLSSAHFKYYTLNSFEVFELDT